MEASKIPRDSDGKLPAYAEGGYPMVYMDRDGSQLCTDCASRDVDDGQAVTHGDVYWEGAAITCDDCGTNRIESAYGVPPAVFDRFDICEAYYCLEADYNVGGILPHRNGRQVAGQLHRMGFRPSPMLGTYDDLTENGRAIYDQWVERHNEETGDV
jgi:hypothetical protein